MELFVDIVSWIFLSVGGALVVIGAFGMVRFPDFWTRIHAASVAETGGMLFLVIGMCLQTGWDLVLVKLILIGVFLFITSPTASHAVANAALVAGEKPTVAEDQKDGAA